MANRIGFTDTLTGKETVCGTCGKLTRQRIFSFSVPFTSVP